MPDLTIPTSGVGRRRAKAIRNRRSVQSSENARAVAAGGHPAHWIALDVCGYCGRIAWLEEGATAEDHEGFSRDSEDHSFYCEVTA